MEARKVLSAIRRCARPDHARLGCSQVCPGDNDLISVACEDALLAHLVFARELARPFEQHFRVQHWIRTVHGVWPLWEGPIRNRLTRRRDQLLHAPGLLARDGTVEIAGRLVHLPGM